MANVWIMGRTHRSIAMHPLADQVALITGAGSATGIGHATALRLAQRGARVAVTDIDARAEARALELRARGFTARGYVCDLTSRSQVDAREVKSGLSPSVNPIVPTGEPWSNTSMRWQRAVCPR